VTDRKVNCLIYKLSFQNKDTDADLLAGKAATATIDTIETVTLKESIHLLLIPATCDRWHLSQIRIKRDTFET
jgi:hypothetical protein